MAMKDIFNYGNSRSDAAIVIATQEGFYADKEGNIFNPKGKRLSNKSKKKSGHICVTVSSARVSVLAHRFIAYYFYGDSVFMNECVRHLNDIPTDNRLCNLALGSKKDNRADIPREKLSKIAKKNAHLLVERSRKLTDEDVLLMREVYSKTNKSYATVAEEFGVAPMTAYRAITKESWKEV